MTTTTTPRQAAPGSPAPAAGRPAPDAARRAGVPAWRTVVTSALVAVAVAASLAALTTVVNAGPWVRDGFVAIALVSAVCCAARIALDRGRGEPSAPPRALLPTLAGLLVGAWYLLARFGAPTQDFDPVVGTAAVDRLVARLGTAGEIIRSESAPVDPTPPLALLLVGGALLVLLVADVLAGGLRAPGAAGLPLLGLWAPALVLDGRVPWTTFVVTVACLLLLLAVDGDPVVAARRAPRGPAARRAAGRRAAGAVAAALAVATVGLLVGGASSAGVGLAGSWTRLFSSTGATVRLADDLDMERSLGERSGEVVLRYDTGPGDNIGPLRLFTLTAFDGGNWRRGNERSGEDFGAGDLLWPEGVGDTTLAVEPRQVDVTVGTLRERRLPLPGEPRRVAIDDGWGYDSQRDEVVGGDSTDEGTTYTLEILDRPLSPEALRDDAGADVDDPNYTEVPASAHAEDVAALTREVVGEAGTRYDQAVALQAYLRDTTRFTYSTEVPEGATGDPVWDFLQHRTGYCVQYATAMTVMARTLGIPARLAVGFLPGTSTGGTTYEVTGRRSHAWPELYFPGEGWVRFEPTPAVQAGPVPVYANPALGGGGNPLPVPTAAAEVPQREAPVQAATPLPSTSASSPAARTDDTSIPGWVWAATAAGGLLLLGGATAWLLLRRRSTVVPTLDAEHAWARVVAVLADHGIELPPATTLRRAPGAVAEAVDARQGARLSEEALDALSRLAAAAEQERYARTFTPPSTADLAELVDVAATGVAEALSARPARAGGPSAPRGA